MNCCGLRRHAMRCIGLGLLAAGAASHAEPPTLIGILQGPAVLVRQSTRFTLVEGVALADGDIVETGKGAFMQIEFGDGALAGIGEASRLILKPRLTGLKTVVPPRFYQLEGWSKLRLPPKSEVRFGLLTPQFELDGNAGSAVVHVRPRGWALFAESGAGGRLLQRDGTKDALGLTKGDFVSQPEGSDKPVVSSQLAADFVQALPRNFRESLPSRGALYATRTIQPQPLGPVSYEDVSAWLHAEPVIRLALSRQWRGRASDRAFRTAAAANLPAHREWERVLFPERFLPKKPAVLPATPATAASAAIN